MTVHADSAQKAATATKKAAAPAGKQLPAARTPAIFEHILVIAFAMECHTLDGQVIDVVVARLLGQCEVKNRPICLKAPGLWQHALVDPSLNQ